jgi:hypothetical protein
MALRFNNRQSVTDHESPKGKQMKRWALCTVVLYAITLLMLTAPTLLIAIFAWGKHVFESNQDAETVVGMLVWTAAFWIIWGFIFHGFAKSDDPTALVVRSTRWLLRGSILELLVAIPSHIIVRRRDDCCAPIGTFWGIATGISVMLLCFGPGVFFLFADRFKRLNPKGVRK